MMPAAKCSRRYPSTCLMLTLQPALCQYFRCGLFLFPRLITLSALRYGQKKDLNLGRALEFEHYGQEKGLISGRGVTRPSWIVDCAESQTVTGAGKYDSQRLKKRMASEAKGLANLPCSGSRWHLSLREMKW